MAYNRKSNQWSAPTKLGQNITTRGGVQNTQQGQQVAAPGSVISQQLITPLTKLPSGSPGGVLGSGIGLASLAVLAIVVYVSVRLGK